MMIADLLLRNAIVTGYPEPVDIAIASGKIVDLAPNLVYHVRQILDLEGRLVVPGFVDPHVHLDIALTQNGATAGRPQPFVSPLELNEATEIRRQSFTRADIQNRAEAALDLAIRHGITAMRAQCHVDLEVGLNHLHALVKVRERYADRLTLQIVAFPQQGLFSPGMLDLFREAFKCGADVMGCAPNLEPGHNREFSRHIDTALALAMELDVDLDAHADLGLMENAGLTDLESVYLAQRAIETGYVGRVTAGHLCTLDSASPEVVDQAIEWIAQARMTVISQPDLFRLGRSDPKHVRRGLTRVKELLAAGVNVAFASNNVRDAYRPLGNLDPLEEALVLAYGAHMDSTAQLDELMHMCTTNPARGLHLGGYGLAPGCQADLVVLEAETSSAAIAHQAEKSYVFKTGKVVARNQRINKLC